MAKKRFKYKKPRIIKRVAKKVPRRNWWNLFVFGGGGEPGIPAPVNDVLPVISGYAGGDDPSPEVGEVLSVSDGTWTGADVITYQWLRDGVEIIGATNNNYTLVNADLNAMIGARVTASNGGGSTDASALEVGPVIFTGDLDIDSVASQSPRTVYYNTLFASLNLPEQVQVTLEDASTIMLSVTWDSGDYSATSISTQAISGALTLPDGITNTGNLSASINVTVEAREIESAPTFPDENVENGTAFGSLSLPANGLFELEDGSTTLLAIVWSSAGYNGSVEGTYVLEGTPTLVAGVINPGTAVKAFINVVVASADAPSYSGGTFSIVSGTLGGGLTYSGATDESNIPPRVTSVVLAGTLQEDEEGEITIVVENNTGFDIASADIDIYRATDQRGGSEALSGSVDPGDVTIDGNVVTGLYTFVVGDVGKYIRAEVTVTLADGSNPTSEAASSVWSDDVVEAAVVVGGITYFGNASNPADNGTLASATVAVTPPGSMQVGDLVVMVSQSRTNPSTHTISQAGGQTWTALSAEGMTANSMRVFWCQFNGTWSADPSVAMSSSAVTNSVVMHVFRPTNTSKVFSLDAAEIHANSVSPSSAVITIAGITTIAASTVSIAICGTADDNTWSVSVGWTQAGTQFRNLAGSDISTAYAYKIRSSAGATGDVAFTQLTVSGDNAITYIMAFKET
jgi:hypothetical protein